MCAKLQLAIESFAFAPPGTPAVKKPCSCLAVLCLKDKGVTIGVDFLVI